MLVYRRDNRPDLSWPDCWDLPGGGREGDESPVECALRELAEEFGLVLEPSRIGYDRLYPSWQYAGQVSHFMALTLTAADITAIRFGSEGQHWTLMDIATFIEHPEAVPHLRARVAEYLTCFAQAAGRIVEVP